MSNYVSLYARKSKYGGKGWAFDCDSGGNITDPKMIDGRIDMMNQCRNYISQHNLDIEVRDMFDIYGRILNMDTRIRFLRPEECKHGVWYDTTKYLPSVWTDYLVCSDGEVYVGCYGIDRTGEAWFHDCNGSYDPDAEYWMVLPDIPVKNNP
jgi:hypothetical protein